MKTRRTVWIGLGTVAAGAAVADLALAQAKPPTHDHGAAPATKQGGESGEAGAAAVAALPPRLRFYRAIALIRGHLLVGDELVQAGRWADALPHFLHPAEEIYGGIKGDIGTYGVPPFEAALKSLAQTVKARRKEAYATAADLVRKPLGTADESLRKLEPDWPRFTMLTALEALHQAADEYEEAIEGGRFTKVVEYQDARGFVFEASRLIESVIDGMASKDPAAVSALRDEMNQLKAVWPAPLPPAKPVKEPGSVFGMIARVEFQAGKLL